MRSVFGREALFSVGALLISAIVVQTLYATIIRPHAEAILASPPPHNLRSVFVILKDYEQETALVLACWALALIGHQARAVTHNRRLLVAAPNYLDKRGRPDSLEALTQHDCLAFMAGGTIYDDWIFEPDGKRQTISIRSAMTSDDADLIRRWTIDGMGISYKSWLDVHEDIANGRLETVLPSVTGELYPLNMICPHREQVSPIVRKLRETLLVYLSRVSLPNTRLL